MATTTPSSPLGIIDYGMGNLHSVTKSLQRLGASCWRLGSGADLCRWEEAGGVALVLPGVGAFDPAMTQLADRDLIQPIGRWVHQDRPLLGICLGLQFVVQWQRRRPVGRAEPGAGHGGAPQAHSR